MFRARNSILENFNFFFLIIIFPIRTFSEDNPPTGDISEMQHWKRSLCLVFRKAHPRLFQDDLVLCNSGGG